MTSQFDNYVPESLKDKLERFRNRKTIPLTSQASDFFTEFEANGIPLSYLYEYSDHEDTYHDATALDFKYWYEEHEDAAAHRRCVLELACMAIDFELRPNHTAKRPSTEGLIRAFNDNGNERITSANPSSALIPYVFGSLVARLANVAYRKVYTADGAKLFLTQPRGFNGYCCPNCETVFKNKRIYELGPEGAQHGHDNLIMRGNPNAWPNPEDMEGE